MSQHYEPATTATETELGRLLERHRSELAEFVAAATGRSVSDVLADAAAAKLAGGDIDANRSMSD
jgi:hypothetical protein